MSMNNLSLEILPLRLQRFYALNYFPSLDFSFGVNELNLISIIITMKAYSQSHTMNTAVHTLCIVLHEEASAPITSFNVDKNKIIAC